MTPESSNRGKRDVSSMQQLAMAVELPFAMVAWILAAGAAGYFLDRWLHTSPFLMLVGGAAGFAGGMRDLLRRLSRTRDPGSRRGGR